MKPGTQDTVDAARGNGDVTRLLTERCDDWYDRRGEGPLSLKEVGKIVRDKPEAAADYQSSDGLSFAQVCTGKVLESLISAKQWRLVENILGVDPADWSQPIDSAQFENFSAVLKELGIK
jgi:hypothetical protein